MWAHYTYMWFIVPFGCWIVGSQLGGVWAGLVGVLIGLWIAYLDWKQTNFDE